MKRPSFQFYPADWRNDSALKLCSMGARGLWIEMICLMHMATPYGHLCAAGRGLDAKDIAKLVGESERDVSKWLEELARNEVCEKTDEGVIFSRRMVRDESVRDARAAGGEAGKEFGKLGAEHGKKGGRPRKERGDKKPPLEPPPSSSSSTSLKEPPTPASGGKGPLTFKAWIESVPEGCDAIPADHSVFAYSAKAGIPDEFLRLAWAWFRGRYIDTKKRYTDWPKHFRNAVESNWGRLWWVTPEGEYKLTTAGMQLERTAVIA